MRLCCHVLDGFFERFWRAHFWCFVCFGYVFVLFYRCFTVLAERFYFGEILRERFIVLALWRCGKPKFYLF